MTECPSWYIDLPINQKENIVNIIGDSQNISLELVEKLIDQTGATKEDCEHLLLWWFSSRQTENTETEETKQDNLINHQNNSSNGNLRLTEEPINVSSPAEAVTNVNENQFLESPSCPEEIEIKEKRKPE